MTQLQTASLLEDILSWVQPCPLCQHPHAPSVTEFNSTWQSHRGPALTTHSGRAHLLFGEEWSPPGSPGAGHRCCLWRGSWVCVIR